MVFSCSSKLVECTIWRAVTSLQWLSNTTGIPKEERFWSAVSEISAIYPNLGGGGLKGTFGELWNDGWWNITAVVVTSLWQRPQTKRQCQAFVHTRKCSYRVLKIFCYVWVQACGVRSCCTNKKQRKWKVLERKCRVSLECFLYVSSSCPIY